MQSKLLGLTLISCPDVHCLGASILGQHRSGSHGLRSVAVHLVRFHTFLLALLGPLAHSYVLIACVTVLGCSNGLCIHTLPVIDVSTCSRFAAVRCRCPAWPQNGRTARVTARHRQLDRVGRSRVTCSELTHS